MCFRFVQTCVFLFLCKEQAEVFRKLQITHSGASSDQSQGPSPQPPSTTGGGVLSSSEEEPAPSPHPPNNTGGDILASSDEEPEASAVSSNVVNEKQTEADTAPAPDAPADVESVEEGSSSSESRSAVENPGIAAPGSPDAQAGSPSASVRSSPSPPKGFPKVEIAVNPDEVRSALQASIPTLLRNETRAPAPDPANGDIASTDQPASHTTADAAAGENVFPSENCPNVDSSGEIPGDKTFDTSGLSVTFRAPSPGDGPGSQNALAATAVPVDPPHDASQIGAISTTFRASPDTAVVEKTPQGSSEGTITLFPTSTLMSDRPPASEGEPADHRSEPPAITSLCFSDLGPSIVKWYTGLPAQFLSRYNALSKRPSNHPVSLDELSRNLSLGLVNSTYFCSRTVKNYDGILVLVARRENVPVGIGFIGCRGRGEGRAVLPRWDPIMIWRDMCFQSLLNLRLKFVFI